MAVRDLWLTARTKQRTARWGQGNRYQVNWEVDGQRRSKTFRRKLDADDFDAELRHKVRSGSYVDPAAGRITVQAYAEQWLSQRLRLRPASRALYTSHLRRHIYPALGRLAMGEVRTTTVQGFAGRLVADGLSPQTVRAIIRTCSTIFGAAVKDQVIVRSPCKDLDLPELVKSRAAALTVEQVYGLAEHMPAEYRAVVLLGAMTGLRPGELLGLEVDPSRGVDMLGRRVLVRQQLHSLAGPPVLALPKTKASVRDVPLADETLDVLAEHMAAFPPVEVEVEDRTGARPVKRTARLLFGTPASLRHARRGAVKRAGFNQAWNRAVERARAAGVELPARVTPHTPRHTYVSLMIARGAGPKTIQALVGHEKISITYDTYGHLFKDEHESTTREAIGAAFGRGEDGPALGVVR